MCSDLSLTLAFVAFTPHLHFAFIRKRPKEEKLIRSEIMVKSIRIPLDSALIQTAAAEKMRKALRGGLISEPFGFAVPL